MRSFLFVMICVIAFLRSNLFLYKRELLPNFRDVPHPK
jgi:hypothetical protein